MIDDLTSDYRDLTDLIGDRWHTLDTMRKLALKALLDQAKCVIERRKGNRRSNV